MTAAATVSVDPRTLQWARVRAAASLEDAAQKCGRGPEDVAGWEGGASDPPLSALRDLAAAYGVPLSVFLLSTPPRTPLPPLDRRVRAGVMEPQTTMDLARALHRAAALQAVARDVIGQLGSVPVERETIGDLGAEELAAVERSALGVSVTEQIRWRDESVALRSWRDAVERQGVFVLQFPMPRADVRAFSLDEFPPLIVLNRSDFVRGRIFSLMHEYGHVRLGTGGICKPGTSKSAMESAAEERYCNLFAGALLVPPEVLRREPAALQIADAEGVPNDALLDRLTRRFHVSRGVVWYRLHQVDMISDATFNAKWDEWGDWFPTPREGGGPSTTAGNVMRDYGASFADLLLSASRRGALTKADVAQYLVVPPGTLSSIEAAAAERLAR